jgi:serine protease AprX
LVTQIHGRLLAACVAALSIGIVVSAQQGNPPGRGGAAIRLKTTEFTPSRGEQPRIPPGLAIAGYASGERGYFIVQFAGPILDAWKADVTATGAELLDYIPEFAFKVRMNPAQAARIAQLDSVVWVGLFHPAYKLEPDVIRNGVRPYTVRIERGADAAATSAMIAATGAQILQRDGATLTVGANSAQLDAIARVLDVASVENLLIRKKNNEYGAGVIIGAGVANAHGYDGSSQTVAVADTGLGTGTPDAFIDIPTSRITNIFNWPGAAGSCFASITNDGAVDVDSGHGTHTTTSILGAGGPSGEGRGTAPAARLIFQAVENFATISSLCRSLYGYANGYYLVGIPSDIRQLFQQAYDGGARVHSNSWGSDAAGAYTADSANADEFVWSHRDMTVTFSAGNAGIDANADGVIDSNSMGSPATAKNVISVGASENDRQGHWECDKALTYTNCSAQSGQNQVFTYGFAWPSDYPANPIKNDPSAGNSQQLAAFSSRGPASDGRIKPDVVAPGTWILSGYSDKFQQEYDPSPNAQTGAYQYDGWGYPLNKYYKYMGGTSMSNPIVAGGAAVIRDFYQKTSAHNASAALVKATLVNSAVDLLDENNDGINDNLNPIPNVHEGWGLVDLAAATAGGREFFDGPTGLLTNSSSTYNFTVSAPGSPLKATLAWSDYPSTASALKNLVNDLDLVVTAPDGTVYLGNVFAGGWSQPSGTADRTNNLENVYVQAATPGTWTISVRGYNIPNGPQPFALVVNATFSAPTAPAAPGGLSASAVSASTIDLRWTDSSDNEDGFQIERCQLSGCTNFAPVGQVGPNVTTFSDSTLAAGTTYNYHVRAFNRGGASGFSNSAEATTGIAQTPAAPTNLVASAVSSSQINLSWADNSSDETGFELQRCQGAGCTTFATIAQLAANVVSYADTNRQASTTFVYHVRAVNAAGASAYSDPATGTTPGVVQPRSHVGDLDGTSSVTGNNWRATVSIAVHRDDHTALSNAMVSGTWGGGTAGPASCTTNASGVCSVTTAQLKRNSGSNVTFTVTNVTQSTFPYNAASNHDDEGDSSGTIITVVKP